MAPPHPSLHTRQRAALADVRDRGGRCLWHQLGYPYNVIEALELRGYVTGETRPAGYELALTDKGREVLEATDGPPTLHWRNDAART